MLIQVTRADIENSRRSDICECAIAIAIKRQTRMDRVRVCHAFAELNRYPTPKLVNFMFPERVRRWLTRYDAGKRVKAIGFTIPDTYLS